MNRLKTLWNKCNKKHEASLKEICFIILIEIIIIIVLSHICSLQGKPKPDYCPYCKRTFNYSTENEAECEKCKYTMIFYEE